jgi:hypothetical protein
MAGSAALNARCNFLALADWLAGFSVDDIRQNDRLRTGGNLGGVFADLLDLRLGVQVGHIIGLTLANIPDPMTFRQSFRVGAGGWTFGGFLV